jgi:hypothetical protein
MEAIINYYPILIFGGNTESISSLSLYSIQNERWSTAIISLAAETEITRLQNMAMTSAY